MESQDHNPGQGNIFLSFYEGSEKSWEIIQQLKAFFKEWNLATFVVRDKESIEPPYTEMMDRLIESRFLLQLFTAHENTRKWMSWEWHTFETARRAQASREAMEPPVVLYTKETDLGHESFGEFKSEIDKGRIRACNINKEREMQSLLGGILVKTKRLHEPHGPIQLPAFCQPAAATERMTWDIVEEFIRNFRGASMKGLERFYADRSEMIPDLKRRFEQLRQEKDLVRMIGFTLKGFVLPDPKDGLAHVFASKPLVKIISKPCSVAIVAQSPSIITESQELEFNTIIHHTSG